MKVENDSRYPYTYACDLIRATGGMDSNGAKMPRSEASQVRQLFATVLGMDDSILASRLADYYLEHQYMILSTVIREEVGRILSNARNW